MGKIIFSNGSPLSIGQVLKDSVGAKGLFQSEKIISQKMVLDSENLAGNYWTNYGVSSNNATVRGSASSFSLNGYGYATKGIANTVNSSLTERYNDSTLAWASISPVGNDFYGISMGGFSLNGLGYLVGGTNGSNVAITDTKKYSDILNSYLTVNSGFDRNRGGSFSLNGFGYWNNGTSSSAGYFSEIHRFNDSTNTWSLDIARDSFSRVSNSVFVLNGYVFDCGGSTGSTINSVVVFNDSLLTSSSKKDMIAVNYVLSSDPLNGFGYTICGNTGVLSNQLSIYNDSTNEWSLKKPNLYAKQIGNSFELNNFLYSFFGTTVAYPYSCISSMHQYRDSSLYKIPGFFVSSTKEPKSITINTTLNNKTYDLPVQIRSKQGTAGTNDNDYWVSSKSNSEIYRPGQTIASLLEADAAGYRKYEIKIGLPVFNSALIQTYSSPTYYGKGGGVWTLKQATPPVTRSGATKGFSLNGYGYSMSGYNFGTSATMSNVMMYNNQIDTWTAKNNLPAARWRAGAYSIQGFGYLVGGGSIADYAQCQNSVYKYNDSIEIWTTETAFISPVIAHCCNSLDGNGYIGLGYYGATSWYSNIVQFYYSTNAYTHKANSGSASRQMAASTHTEDYVMYCGGTLTTTEKYNPASQAIAALTNLSITSGTTGRGAFTLNSFVYTACGNDVNTSTYYNHFEQYNVNQNVWLGRESLRCVAMGEMTNFTLNNCAYLCHGYYYTGAAYEGMNQIWQYTPSENLFEVSVSMKIIEQ